MCNVQKANTTAAKLEVTAIYSNDVGQVELNVHSHFLSLDQQHTKGDIYFCRFLAHRAVG